MPRVYYACEVDAYTAAREQSVHCPLALYVDEDANGFYVTPFGRVGSSFYMGGKHESEIVGDDALWQEELRA